MLSLTLSCLIVLRRLLKFFEFTLLKVEDSGQVVEQKTAVLFQVFSETCRAAPGKRHWETQASRDGTMVAEPKATPRPKPGPRPPKPATETTKRTKANLAQLETLYKRGLLTLPIFREAQLQADRLRDPPPSPPGGSVDPLLRLIASGDIISDPNVAKIPGIHGSAAADVAAAAAAATAASTASMQAAGNLDMRHLSGAALLGLHGVPGAVAAQQQQQQQQQQQMAQQQVLPASSRRGAMRAVTMHPHRQEQQEQQPQLQQQQQPLPPSAASAASARSSDSPVLLSPPVSAAAATGHTGAIKMLQQPTKPVHQLPAAAPSATAGQGAKRLATPGAARASALMRSRHDSCESLEALLEVSTRAASMKPAAAGAAGSGGGGGSTAAAGPPEGAAAAAAASSNSRAALQYESVSGNCQMI